MKIIVITGAIAMIEDFGYLFIFYAAGKLLNMVKFPLFVYMQSVLY